MTCKGILSAACVGLGSAGFLKASVGGVGERNPFSTLSC